VSTILNITNSYHVYCLWSSVEGGIHWRSVAPASRKKPPIPASGPVKVRVLKDHGHVGNSRITLCGQCDKSKASLVSAIHCHIE